MALSAIVSYTRVPASPAGWQTLQRRYAVANPATGRYEPRSWTYSAVAPGLATAAMLEGPLPSSQVGFVDLATGKVTRWVQLDHPVASLAGSPDGSTVVSRPFPWRLKIVMCRSAQGDYKRFAGYGQGH